MLKSTLAIKSNVSDDRCDLYLNFLKTIEHVTPINDIEKGKLFGITDVGLDFYTNKLKYFVS